MNVLNPNTTDKNNTDEKEVLGPDIAMEKARELQEGKITFDDIKDEKLLDEIHERFMIKEEEISEAIQEAPETKVADTEEDETPSTEEKPSQEYLQERKKELDELNTIKQRIESSNKELERLGKLKTESKRINIDDPLSEEAITNINDRVNQLEDSQNTFYEEKSTEVQGEAKKLKQERLLLELQVFQGDAGYKMSKPLKTIDAQYKAFLKNIDGVENASKFLNDEKFRAQKEGEGISIGISDDDFKKYQTISDVHNFKLNGNYPTLNSAFADYAKEKGIVHDKVKQAVINATIETVEQMTNGQDAATTLSPSDGGGVHSVPEMTDAQKAHFIENMPSNPTAAQEKQLDEIHKSLFPS